MGLVGAIGWLVGLFGIMYFLMLRPQKKEQKRLQAMLNDMEVGDSIVTTGGFYGVVFDMTEEDVIVEFGNNRISKELKSGADSHQWLELHFLCHKK